VGDRLAVALSVGGQFQEHLLEPGTVCWAELGEGYPSGPGDSPNRLCVRVDAERSRQVAVSGVVQAVVHECCCGQGCVQLDGLAGGDMGACAGEEVSLRSRGDDAALPDDDQVVGDDLDLVQQMRGQQHGGAAVGVATQEIPHPPDAGRVEPVGGFVEDERGGVAEQSVGKPEALTHPQRVVAQPACSLAVVEPDLVQHVVDATCR
jgi:hypothetical protein